MTMTTRRAVLAWSALTFTILAASASSVFAQASDSDARAEVAAPRRVQVHLHSVTGRRSAVARFGLCYRTFAPVARRSADLEGRIRVTSYEASRLHCTPDDSETPQALCPFGPECVVDVPLPEGAALVVFDVRSDGAQLIDDPAAVAGFDPVRDVTLVGRRHFRPNVIVDVRDIDAPASATIRAAFEQALADFQRMSEEQHVAAARVALARGYDGQAGSLGDVDDAFRHLAEVAPSNPQAREVAREIQARLARGARPSERSAPPPTPAATSAAEARRLALATGIDTWFIDHGIEVEAISVAEREDGPTLLVHFPGYECSRVFLRRTFGAAVRRQLRTAGFKSVSCEDRSTWAMDPL